MLTVTKANCPNNKSFRTDPPGTDNFKESIEQNTHSVCTDRCQQVTACTGRQDTWNTLYTEHCIYYLYSRVKLKKKTGAQLIKEEQKAVHVHATKACKRIVWFPSSN